MKKMMKKLVSLAMVLGVCFGFTVAMASSQGDWSGSFSLTNGSTITHTPTTVSFNGISSTTGIDLSPILYGLGIIISPLCNTLIQPQESKRLFIATLICTAIWSGNFKPIQPTTPTTPKQPN